MKCNYPPCPDNAAPNNSKALCEGHTEAIAFFTYALANLTIGVKVSPTSTQLVTMQTALGMAASIVVQNQQAKANIAPKLVDNMGKAIQ